MSQTASLIFVQLVKDFLATAASVSAGVPAVATLPVVLTHDGSAAKRKELVLAATEATDGTTLVTITGTLCAPMKVKEGDADANGKTLAELDAWRAAIVARLADQPAFYAWLAALSEARRTGYRLMNMHEPRVLDHGADVEKMTVLAPFSIGFRCFTRAH